MTNDLFNNPSNDYVNPGLAPCAGSTDSYAFEFIDDGAGVVGGTDILQFMDLSGISIPVTSWTGEKKTLQSGEVIYIPGLTKGLLNRTQKYYIPNFGEINQKYYMMVDLSINYYYNFRYYDININASADYSTNIDIDDALNISLGNNNIKSTFTYDPSYFTIVGDITGYDFDVTNMFLTIIDASMDSTSPFPAIIIDGERIPQTYTLVEDIASALPNAKYPNGAMLGYILKANYPADYCCNSNWIYMNNVKSPFDVYINNTEINEITDISTYKTITFDPSITFNGIISDISRNGADLVLNPISLIPFEPSIYSSTIDDTAIFNTYIEDSYITDSSILYSSISKSIFGNTIDVSGIGLMYIESNFIVSADVSGNTYITDSSIVNSILYDVSLNNSWLQDSSLINAISINDKLLYNNIFNSNIYNSEILNNINNIINNSNIYDSSIKSCNITSSNLSDTYIMHSYASNTSFSHDFISDSSLEYSIINDSSLINTELKYSTINNNFLKESIIIDSSLNNSYLKSSIINNDSIIIDSSLDNSWINAYNISAGLWTNDVSCTRISINGGNIYDTSINNAIVTDTSIYTSHVYDSSLIRCTIYNVKLNSTDTIDTIKIYINSTCDTSISWTVDTSNNYDKYTKKVDVGMSGPGNSTTLSAGEYLDYINSNNLWDKVGKFAAHFGCTDPTESNIKNLIGGFYLFNPQTYPVQVEYMLVN